MHNTLCPLASYISSTTFLGTLENSGLTDSFSWIRSTASAKSAATDTETNLSLFIIYGFLTLSVPITISIGLSSIALTPFSRTITCDRHAIIRFAPLLCSARAMSISVPARYGKIVNDHAVLALNIPNNIEHMRRFVVPIARLVPDRHRCMQIVRILSGRLRIPCIGRYNTHVVHDVKALHVFANNRQR